MLFPLCPATILGQLKVCGHQGKLLHIWKMNPGSPLKVVALPRIYTRSFSSLACLVCHSLRISLNAYDIERHVKQVAKGKAMLVLKLHTANTHHRASLEVQWLRTRLPMQGTRVRALVWEYPTCRGATKPVHNYWAHVLQLLKPARLEPVLRNKRSHRDEKPVHHKEE